MNAKVTKMMFGMGLLVLLVGHSSTNLIAGGGVMPTGPNGANSANSLIASGGVMPTGPNGAISVA
jgi:hypothetical protein